MTGSSNIKEQVKEYYGGVLDSKHDLKASACCSIEALPAHHRKAMALIDEDLAGCGIAD